jgi:hypothetical protein
MHCAPNPPKYHACVDAPDLLAQVVAKRFTKLVKSDIRYRFAGKATVGRSLLAQSAAPFASGA